MPGPMKDCKLHWKRVRHPLRSHSAASRGQRFMRENVKCVSTPREPCQPVLCVPPFVLLFFVYIFLSVCDLISSFGTFHVRSKAPPPQQAPESVTCPPTRHWRHLHQTSPAHPSSSAHASPSTLPTFTPVRRSSECRFPTVGHGRRFVSSVPFASI